MYSCIYHSDCYSVEIIIMKVSIKHNLFIFLICIFSLSTPVTSVVLSHEFNHYRTSFDDGYGNNDDNNFENNNSYSSYFKDSEDNYDDDDKQYDYEYNNSDDSNNTYENQSDENSEYGNKTPALAPQKPIIKPGKAINLKNKIVRIGRIPYVSIKKLMSQAVPLLHILQKNSGVKEVRLVSTAYNYSTILKALGNKRIDFAWVSPNSYLKYRDKFHLMPIAKAKYGDKTSYKGVIIAPAKGKVQGLEDLQGSRIGFVDPQSASGYVYPMYLLKYLKINLGKHTTILFLKNHDNVLHAVLNGKVDAGCCLEHTLKSSRIKNLFKKIIVLAKTPAIPSDVIVCRQDCPINLRKSFTKALLQIKDTQLPPGIPTFLPASDEDFYPVKAIMHYIGLLSNAKK